MDKVLFEFKEMHILRRWKLISQMRASGLNFIFIYREAECFVIVIPKGENAEKIQIDFGFENFYKIIYL